jgi:lipase chaperone LimK
MSTKNAGIRIRVERDLREAFLSACNAENRKASDVLRDFMAGYAMRNQDGKQIDLFARDDGITTITEARQEE